MQKFVSTLTVLQDGKIVPVQNATATIFKTGTNTQAVIYADDETTTKTQPLLSDAFGLVQAKLPKGTYDILLTSGSISQRVNGYEVYGFPDVVVNTNLNWYNVVNYGAVGDGTTDDRAKLLAAYNACPVGGVLYFPGRSYLCSGLGAFEIKKRITIYADAGAEIVFDNPSASGSGGGRLLIGAGSYGAEVYNLACRHINVTGRTDLPQWQVSNGAKSIVLNGCKSYNSPGAGFGLVNCSQVQVVSPYIQDSRADGFHVSNSVFNQQGQCSGVTLTGGIAVNTGDDSFSIVGYSDANGLETSVLKTCLDISYTNCLSIGSKARAFTIAGATNCHIQGIGDNTTGISAVYLGGDDSPTLGNSGCTADIQLNNHVAATTGQPAGCVQNRNDNCHYKIQVNGTNSHGVLIGSGGSVAAQYSTNLRVDAIVKNAALNGIMVNGIDGLTCGILSAVNIGRHGLSMGNSIKNVEVAEVFVRNSNLSGTAGTYDNIYLDTPINVKLNSVYTNDENNRVRQVLNIGADSGCYIGAYTGLKNGAWADIQRGTPLGDLKREVPSLSNYGGLTYNPGTIAANANVSTTVTVKGATATDFAEAVHTVDVPAVVVKARVTAADTVTVYFINTSTSSVTVGSGQLYAAVRKRLN